MHYDELLGIAVSAMSSALSARKVDETLLRRSILICRIQGRDRVFQRIVPGETPADALVICSVLVDSVTGEHGPVTWPQID